MVHPAVYWWAEEGATSCHDGPQPFLVTVSIMKDGNPSDSSKGSSGPNRRRSPEASDRFSALMEQVRQGSQEAAEQVWREYGPYVVYVVRRSLHESLRSRLDSQDFAQDVWASFFRELPAAEDLKTPAALLQVLTKMARNKVVEEYRRQHTQRRNVDNAVSRGVFLDEDELIDEREPTPSQLLAAEFMVLELTEDQPSECGRIVRLRREGLSDVEIAEREQISTRTVRRVFDGLKRAFRKRWGE